MSSTIQPQVLLNTPESTLFSASAHANRQYDHLHPHGRPASRVTSIPNLSTNITQPVPVRVAAVGVLNAAEQILIGFSRKRYVWDLPQGTVEDGEEPVSAAVRELYEETGLMVQPDQMTRIGLFRHQTAELVFPWETSLFIVNPGVNLDSVINMEPDKCDRLAWFATTQMPLPHGLSLRMLLALLGR